MNGKEVARDDLYSFSLYAGRVRRVYWFIAISRIV